MSTNYWTRAKTNRFTRRRILGSASAAGVGLTGLSLVGCGDDDDSSGGDPTQGSGGTSPTTTGGGDQPKQGGTARYPIFGTNSGDPPTLYPYENISYQVQTTAGYHYSRLLRGAVGPDIGITEFTALEGDLSEGMPEQADDTTYIFTLKPNITFHDKAPMNGRAATAQDFLHTWEYFSASAINAARFNSVIESLEAPDDKTIKITLKEPNAPFLVNGAASDQGIWFIPLETINNDQVKTDPVGTGPWAFESYTTGVSMNWVRHPKYHDSPLPYLERIETALVRDPQRIMAALQSGEFDVSGALLSTQTEEARSKLDGAGQFLFPSAGGGNGFFFNFDLPPWQDKRVRQALSMAMDRDGYLKVLDGTGEGTWNSFFGPALEPYFMSPREDKAEWGDTAKYFEHNIAEAKALLSAAGFPDGLDVNIISNVDRYGPSSQQQWELVASTIREAGFNAQNVYQEYGAYIQSTYFGDITDPKAIGLGPLIGTVLDPDDMFMTCYWSGSARSNWGGTAIPEQAELDGMYVKQRTLLDLEERIEFIKDIQRTMAESFLTIMTIGAPGFQYIQPWMKGTNFKSTYSYMADSYIRSYFTDERIAQG